jgi:hypothetical protein
VLKRDQVVLKKRKQTLGAAIRQVSATDFPLRMRNKVAAELGPGETIVEDDYVGISRGQQLGKWAARKSLPRFGIAIATTEQLRIATVEDEVVTSVLLEDVEVSHDEDNVLTLTISTFGQPTESLTLIFPKRRSPVAQFLRQRGSNPAGFRRFLPGS